MKRASGKSNCPINYTLEILGDQWSLLILRDMFLLGKRSYSEFLESSEKISTNILAERLKTLEIQGIVKKDGREYFVTKKGFNLIPLVVELALWGTKCNLKVAMPKEFIKWATSEPDKFRKEMIQYIEKQLATKKL